MSDSPALQLDRTYLHLLPDGSASEVAVTPSFWQDISSRTELHAGALMMRFSYTQDWAYWERHPHGDEVVLATRGAMTLLLEEADGIRRVELRPGDTVVVPRNVWHTANVPEAAEAIFITPGRGTDHRDR